MEYNGRTLGREGEKEKEERREKKKSKEFPPHDFCLRRDKDGRYGMNGNAEINTEGLPGGLPRLQGLILISKLLLMVRPGSFPVFRLTCLQ